MKLRAANFDDYAAIAALAQRHGLAMKSRERWLELWQQNPACPSVPGDWPMGWVLEDAPMGVVGYLGNIPLAYYCRGQRLLAAATHSWVVEKTARAASMLLLRAYLQQKGVDLFLCTTAKSAPSRIFDTLKIPRMPAPGYDESLYWITHPAGLVASLLTKKGWPGASCAGRLTSPVLVIADRLRGAHKAWQPTNTAVAMPNSFNGEFDMFWERLRQCGTHLMAARDRATLNWHFKEALALGQAWVFTYHVRNELAAYAVFLRQDNPEYQLTRMRLVDYQAVGTGLEPLGLLLAAGLRQCRTIGVHMLEIVGFDQLKRAYVQARGARVRKLPAWMFYYKATQEDWARTLAAPELWDPCFYDGDGSL